MTLLIIDRNAHSLSRVDHRCFHVIEKVHYIESVDGIVRFKDISLVFENTWSQTKVDRLCNEGFGNLGNVAGNG